MSQNCQFLLFMSKTYEVGVRRLRNYPRIAEPGHGLSTLPQDPDSIGTNSISPTGMQLYD